MLIMLLCAAYWTETYTIVLLMICWFVSMCFRTPCHDDNWTAAGLSLGARDWWEKPPRSETLSLMLCFLHVTDTVTAGLCDTGCCWKALLPGNTQRPKTHLNVNTICDFRLLPQSDKKFALLGYYTASSGNSLLIFQDNHCHQCIILRSPKKSSSACNQIKATWIAVFRCPFATWQCKAHTAHTTVNWPYYGSISQNMLPVL